MTDWFVATVIAIIWIGIPLRSIAHSLKTLTDMAERQGAHRRKL